MIRRTSKRKRLDREGPRRFRFISRVERTAVKVEEVVWTTIPHKR